MCEKWRDSFSAFLADMGECPPGHTLERDDVDGHYEPGNCRWATLEEQARNKRNNVWVDLDGEKVILKDYAKAKGINYHSLHRFMKYYGQPADVIAARMLDRKRGAENVTTIISAIRK